MTAQEHEASGCEESNDLAFSARQSTGLRSPQTLQIASFILAHSLSRFLPGEKVTSTFPGEQQQQQHSPWLHPTFSPITTSSNNQSTDAKIP